MTFQSQYVDVLIIGTGPAGSMLAASLSRTGIRNRIIDKKNASLVAGQADGLNQRTLEIFQSLGMIHKLEEQSEKPMNFAVWTPKNGGIERSGSMNYVRDPHTEFFMQLLNQGRIEKLLQANAKLYNDKDVERSVLPVSLKVDGSQVHDDDAYPVEVVVQHLKDEEAMPSQVKAHVKNVDHVPEDGLERSSIGGQTNHTANLIKKVSGRKETEEVIHAKYVVGCDGAWSWTRRQLGIEMVGASTDVIWGAMDIVPITDFPDVRDVGMIQSDSGNILWIPREHGLVRLYTQLTEVKPGEDGSVDRSKITPDQIFEQAKRILQPYKIDYRYCDWWTAYQIGQRVGEAYHDPHKRVFLAGDAVHTHSPKEGLGMNTSMQDTFNLGWKLAAVINKQSPRSILDTYQPERRPIAQQLIELDRRVSAAFSGKAEEGFNISEAYLTQADFMSGHAIQYPPSNIISDVSLTPTKRLTNGHTDHNGTNGTSNGVSHNPAEPNPLDTLKPAALESSPSTVSSLASKIIIGRRLSPIIVKQHTGGIRTSLLSLSRFTGRWPLFVFAGDVRNPTQLARVNAFARAISDPKTGILHLKHTLHLPLAVPFPYALHTESGRRVQKTEREVPLVDVFAVHGSTWGETELGAFDDVYWPMSEDLGREYGRIHYGEDVWEKLGVSVAEGCVVLCRPDQHVAWIGSVDDARGLRGFLEGCMLL